MTRANKILGRLALASAVALSLEASAHARTGAYVGVNVGYANLNPNAKAYASLYSGHGEQPINKIDKTKGEIQTNVLVGYEWMRPSNVMFGTELAVGATFSDAVTKYIADAPIGAGDLREYKIRQQWKVGLYGLVGTSLSERVSLYGKLGVLYSRFGSSHSSAAGISGASNSKITHQTNFWGIEPGVRLKVALSHGWAAMLDASYAFYQDKSESTFATNEDIQKLSKYAPRMWGVTAGLAYKF